MMSTIRGFFYVVLGYFLINKFGWETGLIAGTVIIWCEWNTFAIYTLQKSQTTLGEVVDDHDVEIRYIMEDVEKIQNSQQSTNTDFWRMN